MPYISLADAKRLADRGTKLLRDGDLDDVCAEIFQNHLPNQDRFAVGGIYAHYPRSLDAALFTLLDACLGTDRGEQNRDYALMYARAVLPGEQNRLFLKLSMGLLLSRAKEPAEHLKARELLEQLAASKRMPRAEGYAALARLRAEPPGTKTSDEVQAALRRCKAMTRRPGVCPDLDSL